jgi:hypothetical protein
MGKSFHDSVSTLLLVWPDGRAKTASGGYADLSDQAFFKAIFKDEKDFAYGSASRSKASNEQAIMLARAVKGEKGAIRAAVCCELKLSTLSTLMSNMKLGKTGYGWLVDQTGFAIAHPDQGTVLKLNLADSEKGGYRGLEFLFKKMGTETAGWGRDTAPAGQKIVTYYSGIALSPGWRIGLSISERGIFAGQRSPGTRSSRSRNGATRISRPSSPSRDEKRKFGQRWPGLHITRRPGPVLRPAWGGSGSPSPSTSSPHLVYSCTKQAQI